jgi:hypothetical protein
MIRAAILCLMASPVVAEQTAIIGDYRGQSTTVTLQPSDAPGAVAEVVMHNQAVNGLEDDGTYTLTGAITVDVQFTWGSAGDTITVTPPLGFIAFPETITVQEGATGVVVIYSAEGVGS